LTKTLLHNKDPGNYCAHTAKNEVTQVPKNVWKMLIIVLALSVLSAIIPQVYSTPSSTVQKEVSSLAPEIAVTNPQKKLATVSSASASLNVEQNPSPPSPVQFVYTIAALWAVPMTVTGYLFYKCRKLVHKLPLFSGLNAKFPFFIANTFCLSNRLDSLREICAFNYKL
jgi:hypothetical protein